MYAFEFIALNIYHKKNRLKPHVLTTQLKNKLKEQSKYEKIKQKEVIKRQHK